MAATERHGHVSRHRLFGPGSAFANQADEQRLQQQAAQAEQAPEQQEEEELPQAQVTWPELWDARTTAGFVGQQLQQDFASLKSMQLKWGANSAHQRERHLKHQHTSLIQYSGVLARVLQQGSHLTKRKSQGQAAAAGQEVGPAPNPVTITDPQQLFGPPLKRRRLQQQTASQRHDNQQSGSGVAGSGHPLTAWVCCNVIEQADADNQRTDAPCATPNAAKAGICAVCGAARWDGPAGQMQQRISAALQTADLDTTNLRQVTARVLAESGSRPGVGLTPQAGMYAEVTAVVQARLLAKAAAVPRSDEEAASAPQDVVGSGISTASAPAGHTLSHDAEAGELQLLSEHGVLFAAHGVYSSLVTCMQQPRHPRRHQQQQQQQQQQLLGSQADCSNAPLRLQSAAAGAAALVPGLLVSMLRQQAGAPAVKLSHKSPVASWVVSCMEDAAAAATAAHAQAFPAQHQQQREPSGQPCIAMRQPLPLTTLLGLCDRRGAAIRQAIADTAASAVAACGGRLPVIMRSYELDGFELVSDEVPLHEWLWDHRQADSEQERWLHAVEGQGPTQRDDVRRERGDLLVLESITSQHWDEVVFVRKRVHALLEAWRRLVLKQHGSSRQPDPPLSLQGGVFPRRQWDSQMRKLLAWQVQRMAGGWGSAAALCLRQGLSARRHQRQKHPQQPMAQPEQEPRPAGRAGPAAAAGRRRSTQQQAQGAIGAAEQQKQQQPQGGLSSGSDSAEDFSNLSESESDEDSGSEYVDKSDDDDSDAEHGFNEQRGGGSGSSRRRKRARFAGAQGQLGGDAQQQADDFEVSCAELEAWLEGFDDLMLPQESNQGCEAAAGSGPSCQAAQGGSQPERQPWRQAANSVWTPVADGGQFAADDKCVRSGSDTRGDTGVATQGGAMATSAVEGWAILPGVQLVLGQASKAGIAPVVLQRTARRLQEILTCGQRGCNQD